MSSVARSTCKRKQIIAEFMFLDSSKNNLKNPKKTSCSARWFRLLLRSWQQDCICLKSFLLCFIVQNLWIKKITQSHRSRIQTRKSHISRSLWQNNPMKFWLKGKVPNKLVNLMRNWSKPILSHIQAILCKINFMFLILNFIVPSITDHHLDLKGEQSVLLQTDALQWYKPAAFYLYYTSFSGKKSNSKNNKKKKCSVHIKLVSAEILLQDEVTRLLT